MTITFAILFVIGVVGIAVILTRKVPLVLGTPRQVVNDYFDQESARIHIRLLRVKRWFQDGEYWDPILFLLIRMLRMVRILALKLDRISFDWLQVLQEHYEIQKNGGAAEEPEVAALSEKPKYWDELKGPAPVDLKKEETTTL